MLARSYIAKPESNGLETGCKVHRVVIIPDCNSNVLGRCPNEKFMFKPPFRLHEFLSSPDVRRVLSIVSAQYAGNSVGVSEQILEVSIVSSALIRKRTQSLQFI